MILEFIIHFYRILCLVYWCIISLTPGQCWATSASIEPGLARYDLSGFTWDHHIRVQDVGGLVRQLLGVPVVVLHPDLKAGLWIPPRPVPQYGAAVLTLRGDLVHLYPQSGNCLEASSHARPAAADVADLRRWEQRALRGKMFRSDMPRNNVNS